MSNINITVNPGTVAIVGAICMAVTACYGIHSYERRCIRLKNMEHDFMTAQKMANASVQEEFSKDPL